MHVSFIHIFLCHFLVDVLVDVLILKIGHLCVSLGTIDSHIWDDFWHLRVQEGCWCLGHDGWIEAIYVGRDKIPLHLLHHLEKLVQGYRSNIEDLSL